MCAVLTYLYKTYLALRLVLLWCHICALLSCYIFRPVHVFTCIFHTLWADPSANLQTFKLTYYVTISTWTGGLDMSQSIYSPKTLTSYSGWTGHLTGWPLHPFHQKETSTGQALAKVHVSVCIQACTHTVCANTVRFPLPKDTYIRMSGRWTNRHPLSQSFTLLSGLSTSHHHLSCAVCLGMWVGGWLQGN